MRFLVNCPFGLSSILGNELKYLGLKPNNSFETGVYFEGEHKDMIQVNLRSRIANKVYLEASFGPCFNFDALFALVQTVDWNNYVEKGQNIVVNVHTKGSKLESGRTIQSITNKAIYKQISPTGTWPMDPKKDVLEIFVMIINDQASIFINSSGAPLHQRGYRTQTGEAPLKENMAAALVLLSNWKYASPFWDPFCGSGTLGIEAAMLARNIAPGLKRTFAFQGWKDVNFDEFKELKTNAKSKQYKDKKYQIYCTDVDENVLEIAKTNAEQAGVGDTISFMKHDILDPLLPYELGNLTIVSNPPYGKRLTGNDLEKLYNHLISHIQNSNGGGFITSYRECQNMLPTTWHRKKLFNGADEVVFYFR